MCGLLLAVPVMQASQDNEKRIRFELYGGYSNLNLADLNQRPEYDRLYENYFTEDRYAYYHAAFGNFVTYSGRIDGEFKRIDYALPIGIRVRYDLNPTLALSVGFKYLSSRQDSRVTHKYDIRIINPDGVQFYDEFSMTVENGPYSLSVEAYVPMLGIHYKVGAIRAINLEAYAAAGPVFANCDFLRQRLSTTVDTYEYEIEQSLSQAMEGKGTGLALDVGLQMNIQMIENIHLLLEGGYAVQFAGNLSGPGNSESGYDDSNSIGFTENAAWEGPWAVVEGSLDREWGNLPYSYPTNRYGTEGLSDFRLDLSGFQIRMGISFRL
jgi:hypothetical protein